MKWRCKCLRGEEEEVRELDYQRCNLEEVPADVFNYERTLEILHLDSNHLTELPRQLFHCHGLMVLGISDNGIQYLPPAIASLIHLQSLDASKNSLEELPDNLKGCKCLSKVNLSSNQLEKLPEGFTQLLNLTEVYLNDTLLDFLPANLGRLGKLRILELRDNYLNTLPKSMARLTSLQRLDIGQNEFSEFPEEIGNLPELRELWIDSNKIKSIPQEIGNLTKLELLDASNNRIDYIAPSIGKCQNLQDLLLSQNCIEELPPSICHLKQLELLKLDENQLVGLPEDIGSVSSLKEMLLSHNDMETFPKSIGLLRKLQILIADENMIEDLPPELGSCVSLRILSVRSNRLVQIPGELGHLPELQVLNFTENHLVHLPCSFSKFNQLQALWLSTNQNKPLVPLQLDEDPETGHRVLTCYLLPQQPYIPEPKPETSDTESFDQTAWEAERSRRSLVRFAPEGGQSVDEPGRLTRAPTPYPKELRALQRQVKEKQKKGPTTDDKTPASVRHEQYTPPSRKQRLSITSSQEEDSSLEAGMVLPSQAPHQVREAKVTKQPSPDSAKQDKVEPASSTEKGKHLPDTSRQTTSGTSDKKTTDPSKVELEFTTPTPTPLSKPDGRLLGNATAPLYKPIGSVGEPKVISSISSIEKTSYKTTSTVGPVQEAKSRYSLSIGGEGVQEAKCRLSVSPGKNEISAASTGIQGEENMYAKGKTPPPYHVAAAYSKHAAHFANNNASGMGAEKPRPYAGPRTATGTPLSWTSSLTSSPAGQKLGSSPLSSQNTTPMSSYPKPAGTPANDSSSSTSGLENHEEPPPVNKMVTSSIEKTTTTKTSITPSSLGPVKTTETLSSSKKTREETTTTFVNDKRKESEPSLVNGVLGKEPRNGYDVDAADGFKKSHEIRKGSSTEKLVNGVVSEESSPMKNGSRKGSVDIEKLDLKNNVDKVIEAIDQSMLNRGLVATIDTLRKGDSSDEGDFLLLTNGEAEAAVPSPVDGSAEQPPPLAPKPMSKIPSPSGSPSKIESSESTPSRMGKKISPPSGTSPGDSRIPKPGAKTSHLPVTSGSSPAGAAKPSNIPAAKASSGSAIPKLGSSSKLSGSPPTSNIPSASSSSGIPKPSYGLSSHKSSIPAPISTKSGIPSHSGSSNLMQSQKTGSGTSLTSPTAKTGIPLPSSTPGSKSGSTGIPTPSKSGIPSLTSSKPSTPSSASTSHYRKTSAESSGSHIPSTSSYHKSPSESAAPSKKLSESSGLPSYRRASPSRDSSPISRTTQQRDHSPSSAINTGTFKRNSMESNRKFSADSGSTHAKKSSDAYRKTSSTAFSKPSVGGGGMALDGHILGRNVATSKPPSRIEKPAIQSQIMDIDHNRVNNNNNDAWNYGSHRNPKVFPVVIEKNPGLGFSISGGSGSPINPLKPNDEGIYVTRVHPSGPASTALRAGDRLLKVDSVDFSSVSHSDAVNVLTGTGNTVSIVVSRPRDAYSD